MTRSARRGGGENPPNAPTEIELLRILVAVTSRAAFSKGELRKIIVSESRVPSRWINAYNACDGTRTQGEIAAVAEVDMGDLSRALVRWTSEGAVFRVGPSRLPFGLYPLPVEKEPSINISKADVGRGSE